MDSKDFQITFSGISLYNRCPKAYEYRYIHKLVPAKDDRKALRFGSIVHQGLANHWLGLPLYHNISFNDITFNSECSINEINLGDFGSLGLDDLKALAMIEAYHAYYKEDGLHYTVESIEAGFKTGHYKGQVDGVIYEGGDRVLLEHKTASEADELYWLHLNIDLQIRLYAYAVGVNSVLYDVLVKPKIKQRKDETVLQFLDRYKAACVFDRRRIYINCDTVSEALEDAEQVRKDIINGRFPRSRSNCKGLYNCPYSAMCGHTCTEGDYIEREQDEELVGKDIYIK